MSAEINAKVQSLVEGIEQLTVLELSELVKTLEDKFGVKASAPMMAGPVAGAVQSAAPVEEQTEFKVMLTGVGDKKLQVVKEVRAVTSLGLKEAKDLVEGELPALVKEKISKKEAEDIKIKLEAAGAVVEIK